MHGGGCPGGFLKHGFIEVDHLPWKMFSWFPPLLVNVIGNIKQGLHNTPRTTPGLENFLLLILALLLYHTTPSLLHGTADHGTLWRT